MLPSGSPLHSIKDLKALQSEIPLTSDDLAKDPEPELFPDCVSCTILEPEIDRLPEHCVILLHDKGQQEKSQRLSAQIKISSSENCLPTSSRPHKIVWQRTSLSMGLLSQ